MPTRRRNEIVHGKRAIPADTALRLARFFGASEQFSSSLQARHDLEVERARLGAHLTREVEVFAGVGQRRLQLTEPSMGVARRSAPRHRV